MPLFPLTAREVLPCADPAVLLKTTHRTAAFTPGGQRPRLRQHTNRRSSRRQNRRNRCSSKAASTFYILTNVALFACMGMLWERWLREVGVHTPIAVTLPAVAMTCLTQADNVMCGWQACIFLCSLALIGILWAYRQSRIGYLVVLSLCAGLTFSSTDALPLMFASLFMIDYIRERNNHVAFLRALLLLTVSLSCLLRRCGRGEERTGG